MQHCEQAGASHRALLLQGPYPPRVLGPIFPMVGEGRGDDGFLRDQIHESSILNSIVCLSRLWILLRGTFSFGRSGMRPEVLHSSKLPGDARAAGARLGPPFG